MPQGLGVGDDTPLPGLGGGSLSGSSGSGGITSGRVLLEPFTGHKPFLGGYKDRRTALEYHDAYTQTPAPPPAWERLPPKVHRDTQTSGDMVSHAAQSRREGVAQTTAHVRGLYQSTAGDRVLVPRTPYFSSEMKAALWERMAVVIQKHWRASEARKEARGLQAAAGAAAVARAEAEAAAAAAAEARAALELERRLHPRTPADFAVLYDEVEAWRVATTARIHAEVAAGDWTAAFSEMLTKETALIGTIERLRSEAGKVNKEAAIARRLGAMGQAQHWGLSHIPKAARLPQVEVTTPLTVRAAELKRLYDALGLEGLGQEDRTEVLLHVKFTIAEVDCQLSRELSVLIDRELDLMARDRPGPTLASLRSRIKTLFLAFCDTPEFNPLAARHGQPGPGRDRRTQGSMLRTQPLPPGGGPVTKPKPFMINRDGSMTGRGGGRSSGSASQ